MAPAPVILDDFESYQTDAELAKSWYQPGHGSRGVLSLAKALGGQALRFDYETFAEPGKEYAAFCRVDLWPVEPGHNALQFWFNPDGSGHSVNAEINIADSNGANVHDLWGFTLLPPAGDSEPRLVTIPFRDLVRPKWLDGSGKDPAFALRDVNEVAFYVHPTSPDAHGNGFFLVDLITVIHLAD